MHDIFHPESSAFSPETWPFQLEWLPQPAYLVGGAVRDALLGRRSEYLDLDFVVPEKAVKIASDLAKRCQAGFVVLDAQRQIARVVFEQATVDFAQQEGASLETDLQRRDYTVNAIAYNPHTQQLIDPLQGYADLQQRLIRMVSPANLEDDPLRLLRAYRQAAQLGFTLEPVTESTLAQLAPLLAHVAAERVQTEVNYLLATPQGTPWLMAAWENHLLSHWFPSGSAAGVAQIAAIDRAVEEIATVWPVLAAQLWRGSRTVTPAVGLCKHLLASAKLTRLLASDFNQAQEELIRFKYGRSEIRIVTTTLKYLPELQSASELSLRQQYFFFRGVGELFPGVVAIAVATGTPLEAIAPLIERYLNPEDRVAHPIPLVTGRDLMSALNLKPGQVVGELLTAIQIAQAEGQIHTVAEALDLATQLHQDHH